VPGTELVFEHEIDLPASVVWDALVDPVLLEGWLAAVEPSPLAAPAIAIDWLDGSEPSPTAAAVELVEPPRRLRLGTDNRGSIDLRLTEVPGGLRGMGTVLELRVRVPVDARFAAAIAADWESALDRLDDLLRGRPAEWAAVRRRRAAKRAHMSTRDNIR